MQQSLFFFLVLKVRFNVGKGTIIENLIPTTFSGAGGALAHRRRKPSVSHAQFTLCLSSFTASFSFLVIFFPFLKPYRTFLTLKLMVRTSTNKTGRRWCPAFPISTSQHAAPLWKKPSLIEPPIFRFEILFTRKEISSQATAYDKLLLGDTTSITGTAMFLWFSPSASILGLNHICLTAKSLLISVHWPPPSWPSSASQRELRFTSVGPFHVWPIKVSKAH